MTKQEEIKEILKRVIRETYLDGYNARCNGEVWEQEDGSVKFPEQGVLIKTFHLERELDKQGVVIKVDRELPKLVSLTGKASLSEKCAYALGVSDMAEKMAGCVAVEPLTL